MKPIFVLYYIAYQVCNFILASRVLRFSKVVQVCNLSFARIILGLGPPVESGDLLLAGRVLSVELALQLGDVRDAGLVVLLLSLLQRSGVNVTNVLIPKAQKETVKSSVFFALLRSACKTLVKMTPENIKKIPRMKSKDF